MDRLPFEVLLQIFEYLALSDFKALYTLFPQHMIDEALVFKLRNNKKEPIIQLVSTNLHELSSNNIHPKKNESFISLYYTSFDPVHRIIWSLPDFISKDQHYFRVKDTYVSHGKLLIKSPNDDTCVSIPLTSLWDIRKVFPPSRAGSFSGASEYTKTAHLQELTLYHECCLLDSCLIPATQYHHGTKSVIKKEEDTLKRPHLPPHYSRELPKQQQHPLLLIPTYSDITCGYFLVERLATSISTLLDLYCK